MAEHMYDPPRPRPTHTQAYEKAEAMHTYLAEHVSEKWYSIVTSKRFRNWISAPQRVHQVRVGWNMCVLVGVGPPGACGLEYECACGWASHLF